MTNAERLRDLAAAIREDYCAAYRAYEHRNTFVESTYGLKPMPRWDGGQDRWGTKRKSVWEKVAAFVLKHKIDHQVLIREVFECRSGDLRTPNDLMTEEALQLYAAAPGRIKEACRVGYEADTSELRKVVYIHQKMNPGSTEREALQEALWSPLADLSPLFRYCLACCMADLNTMAEFRQQAFWQYLRAVEAYDEVMGGVIPEDVRQEAYAFREAHAAGG